VTVKRDPGRHPHFVGQRHQTRLQAAVIDSQHVQPQAGLGSHRRGERADKDIDALLLRDPADEKHSGAPSLRCV